MSKRRVKLLAIAIVLALAAVLLTSLLLFPDVVKADRGAFLYLNSLQDPSLTNVFWMFTVLGSLEFGLIWFGGLWVMKRSDLAACVLVAILLEIIIITFMKEAIMRPRPFDNITSFGWLYGQDSWSFPSGHAAGAFTLATVIGLKVRKMLPVVMVLALLVAFSRIYIGVHYPLDVMAGSLLGILIGLLAVNLDLSRLARYLTSGRNYLERKLGH
jgi:undecaprenyl-diphosphatase